MSLIAALGQTAVGFLGFTPRFETNVTTELSEVTVQIEGRAAIATATASCFGADTRLCTNIGSDFLAPFVKDSLSDIGVTTLPISSSQDILSPFHFEALHPETQQRIRFASPHNVDDLNSKDINPEALLQGAAALIIDATFPAAQIVMAEAAKANGIPVIFGTNHLRHGVGELVALADVLIASEQLAIELAPRGELQDSLQELQRMGPNHVILTLGKEGCIALSNDMLVEQSAFDVIVVDNGNAGGVFHGAFTAAYISDNDFVASLKIATAAAALSCRAHGAFAGIPTLSEVNELVAENS